MTNRDRDALAELLRKLAERIAATPTSVAERAQKAATEMGIVAMNDVFVASYQVGGLGFALEATARELRHLVDYYLTPRATKKRQGGR